MFLDNLLQKLNQTQTGPQPDKETRRAMAKMRKQKRLSSQEFLKVYDNIWQQGPTTKYQTPDSWTNHKNRI